MLVLVLLPAHTPDKESVNCRLEAQYAFQQQKEMVPLMLQEGYRANGWLGMLLGEAGHTLYM